MRRLLPPIAWLIGLSLLPGVADAKTFALVVGNNAPPTIDTTLEQLRFADDDAVRFYQLLSRVADDAWLLSVLDKDTQQRHQQAASIAQAPTVEAFERAVSQIEAAIADAKGERTTVYLVFSGHGASTPEGSPYLALQDGLLTREHLYDRVLARWPATVVHVVIDACNAGAMVGARGPFGRTVDAQREAVAAPEARAVIESGSLARFPNVGAIVATSEGREAHEWSRIESGVFTHELLSGALGAADVNGDRQVEYSELVAFVSSANSRVDDPRAKPNVIALPPSIHRRAAWIALDQVRDVVEVRGDPTHLGRFFVELDNGQRYLDAHIAPRERLSFVLPAKTRAFLRTPSFELALYSNADPIVLDLRERKRITVASRGVDHTYRKALFAAPYGRTYYRGFVDSQGMVSVPTDDLAVVYERTDAGPPLRSWIAFGVGAAATAAAVGLGVYAAKTKRDFEATDIQQRAIDLSARYDRLVIGTIISAGVAAASTGLGVWFWVDDDDGLDDAALDGGPTALFGVSGRF